METGKFLERRELLADAVAVEPTCKGCSGASGFKATTPGEAGTLWCAACVDLSIDTHPAALWATPFDCVLEDDGET